MNPYKPREVGSASDALARMMTEISAISGRENGAQVAADFEGISVYTIYKALDPDQREDLGFRRIARLTSHFGCTAAVEHLATLAGGVFLPIPKDSTPSRWGELSAEAAEDFGRLMSDVFKALLPSSEGASAVTPREAEVILRDLEEVTRVIAGLTALARQAKESSA